MSNNTIQQVLSNYPSVEKAFKAFINTENPYLVDNMEKYTFNTLEGYIRAFFRENDVHINIIRKAAHFRADIYDTEYFHMNQYRTANTYETAFLSALDAACKYLEPKL